MQIFSDILKSHIVSADIKVQSLAKNSGIDRTLIQKMIKGDRVPADKEILEKLIIALMLTPQQAEELRSLYLIARMGEQIYSRHMLVKDMIESFGESSKNTKLPFITEYSHTLGNIPDTGAIYGSNNINAAIKAVIEVEVSKSNGYIKIIAQPEYTFLMQLLSIVGNERPDLTIQHIFCLQKSIREDSENRYNIECIKNIIPLLISGCNYNPFVYYDDIQAHINQTTIFPYLLITSDIVVNISADLSYATVFHTDSITQMYCNVYNDIFKNSRPLISKINSAMESFMNYSKSEKGHSSIWYSLISQPCLLYFLNEEMINKYINKDISQKDELIELFITRNNQYLKQLKYSFKVASYFSKEGLDSFIETGRLFEIPSEFYTPIEKSHCISTLNTMYDYCVNDLYDANIFDSDKFKMPENLVIAALGDSLVYIVYVNDKQKTSYFSLSEKSVAYSIYSFMEYLKESDFIIPKKDTMNFIKSKLME